MSFLERIRKALGLNGDATEDQMVEEATAVREARDEARAQAAVDKHAERISPAMRDAMLALARRDPDGFEAVAAAMPVVAEADEARAQAAVGQYTAEGRVPPAAREQALVLARRDPDAFAAFAGSLPMAVTSAAARGLPRTTGGTLNDVETAAARAMGLTDEQYQESRQALAQAGARGDV